MSKRKFAPITPKNRKTTRVHIQKYVHGKPYISIIELFSCIV